MSESVTSDAPLDLNSAAAAFSTMSVFDDKPEPEKDQESQPDVRAESQQDTEAEPEDVAEQSDDEPKRYTIKVDGKDVEVTEAELADAYKSGLRQKDYTQKTMELSEQRKAAEAEMHQMRMERSQYAQGLNQARALLESQLGEQQNIDWQQLLQNDPIQYLEQQRLAQERQARLQQVYQEQQRIESINQAEAQRVYQDNLQRQHQELIAKLPEWADSKKAAAEKTELRAWLKETGFNDDELNGLSDHRAVILARKAMLYDKMIGKANASAKKVQTAPQKVERPGVAETRGLDKRGQAWNRLTKSGKIDDAAAVFASLL